MHPEIAQNSLQSVKLKGRKSTIITTNLGFDRWTEIFLDEVLTAAMVDRLTHKAIFINMSGTSFRVKETKNLV